MKRINQSGRWRNFSDFDRSKFGREGVNIPGIIRKSPKLEGREQEQGLVYLQRIFGPRKPCNVLKLKLMS